MDKQKFVDILSSQLYGFSIDTIEDCVYVAEILYNAGYRKITDAVVLTKEKRNDLEYKAYARGVNSFNTLHEKQLSKARKETATITERGQADWLDGYKVGFKDGVVALRTQFKVKIDEICKELTEGKV